MAMQPKSARTHYCVVATTNRRTTTCHGVMHTFCSFGRHTSYPLIDSDSLVRLQSSDDDDDDETDRPTDRPTVKSSIDSFIHHARDDDDAFDDGFAFDDDAATCADAKPKASAAAAASAIDDGSNKRGRCVDRVRGGAARRRVGAVCGGGGGERDGERARGDAGTTEWGIRRRRVRGVGGFVRVDSDG